jgi:uncharacterized protein (TIGR02268 family)
MVTTAEAQAQAMRGRRVTVAASPGEPLPEVRVAAGSVTVVVLTAPVDKGSVQLDTARIRLVDVGERTLVIEPVVTPGATERWVLRVRYTDGARPEWAAFALVSHPGEVDLQVTAVRQRQTLEACQEQLAAEQARCAGARAEVWVLADRLGGKAVQAEQILARHAEGWAYQLGDVVLLVVTPTKKAGPPWTPTEATLRGNEAPNEEVKVRAVHVREGQSAPGEWSTLAVEAELPTPAAGSAFILELRDGSGQSLTVDGVVIPPATQTQWKGGER